MNTHQRVNRRAFTLLELLVVISIVVIVSAATLPVVIPAIAHRQVSESARLLQASIAGARDAAIRANAPRGIRLLPDPAFPGPGLLAANRMISIESAPDYTSGKVNIPGPQGLPSFLIIEEEAFTTFTDINGNTTNTPNEPTSWYWNIRQGDKIRFDDSGRYYTIAGPVRNVIAPPTTGIFPTNVERYINYGPQGYVFNSGINPLPDFTALGGNAVLNNNNPINTTSNGRFPEFLIVMNGQDDDGDGWIDEGFDGIDNDGDGVIDPGFDGLDNNGNGLIDEALELTWTLNNTFAGEFEQEKFVGNQFTGVMVRDQKYTIFRRPVVSEGAREVALPQGVVIDMTTWNAAASRDFNNNPIGGVPERSRLPVDPFTLYVDIMLSPSGQVINSGPGQTTLGATPVGNVPFYHFWLAERDDVFDTIWTSGAGTPNTGQPNFFPYANPQYSAGFHYMLPMPKGTVNYNPQAINGSLPQQLFLKGDRRLVTLFVRSGLVVTNTIETFDGSDVNTPFYAPQVGTRDQ